MLQRVELFVCLVRPASPKPPSQSVGQGCLEGEDGEAFSQVNGAFAFRSIENWETVLAGWCGTRQGTSCFLP